MSDLINNQKRKTAGGDLRLGSTSNPPDALPSVEAPTPVELPASISIDVPPPDVPQTSKVSDSPPSIVAPPARQPVMAVHLDSAEDAQVAADTAAIREAANDPLPGAEYVAPSAPWEALVPFSRGTGEQYTRPQEMTAEQAASAYLQPDANKAAAAAQAERSISNTAIEALGPDDFIPYMINQPELRNLVADNAQQRQSIFAQYANENKANEQYATALAAQVEQDRLAKNSSTSDGLDWVRTIIGQRDGVRTYNAPVQFNQQTKEYDMNLLGAVLYPLGVIQNTAIGAALDGRQLLRQLGNVVPPQHREFADRFIRRTNFIGKMGIAQWVLNGNKYDDGKSNIIEAIRGAQYSFSDDSGEGIGIGIQQGAFKTPKLPFVGEVGVNPSKLVGFAGDVFVGAKLDKLVGAAAKRLGMVKRAPPVTPAAAPAVSAAPRRPPLPPSPQRAQLPPARSAIPTAGGAPLQRPRQLPPARQQVVVLPPPRRAYVPQPRLPQSAERKLLMPSRVAELRRPLSATPKEKLQLLKPLSAKPVFNGKEVISKLLTELDDIFTENADVLKKYDFQAAPLNDKLEAVNTFLDSAVAAKPLNVINNLSKPRNPVVQIIKEQLSQSEWWGTSQGVRLATHLDELLTTAPQKTEEALTKSGVDVEQLRQVLDDAVPAADTQKVIAEVQQQLPQLDEVTNAVNESLVAQEVRNQLKQSQRNAIVKQSDTLDVGRNQLDDELLPGRDYIDAPRIELPLTPVKNSKAYHGTRVKDLDISAIDPIDGAARNELGSGVYSYGSKASAAMPAKADAAINLPELPTREFGDGVIHEMQLSGNVLDGKAQLPQLRQLTDAFATPEIKAALDASSDNSVVGILDTVGANTSEEAALQFQQRFTQALRDNGVQHIKAGRITSTIDTRSVVTKGITPVKNAGADISPEVMLRNRLKMERDAVEQTGSQFLRSTAADTAVRVESQALDGADEAIEAAQIKTFDAVKRSGLLDDVVPQPKIAATTKPATPLLGTTRYTLEDVDELDTEWYALTERGSTFRGGKTDGSVDRIRIALRKYLTEGSDGLLAETLNEGAPEQSWLGMMRYAVDGTMRTGGKGAVERSQLWDMGWSLIRRFQEEAPEALESAFAKIGKAMYPYKEVADKRNISAADWLKQADQYYNKPPVTTATVVAKVDNVVSRYVDTAKRSSDEYVSALTAGRVPAKRGEDFTALVRDILDGHVDDPKLISLLEGKYAKLYDQVADKIYNESYSTLLPQSVKAVSSAIDDTMAEIAKHPIDNVPPALQSKLDELLDEIDDEAFDRKFNDALESNTPPAKNADNPSSPCEI